MEEDIFLKKFDNHFVVIGLNWHNFYPFRDIIHNNQDELLPNEFGNGPMKLIPQTSKISTLRIGFRGIMSLLEIFPIL